MSIQGDIDAGVASIPMLRDAARGLEPVIRIGKNGLTPGMIGEIGAQLKQRRLIKVRLLQAFTEGKDKKDIAKEIAEKTGAVLVQQVGSVVVLYRKKG